MYENLTLKDWQNIYKPIDELIVQASVIDGSDRSEAFDFSIGMNHVYLLLSREQQKSTQIGNHHKLVLCAIEGWTDRRRRGNSIINRKQILKTINKNNIRNLKLKPNMYFNNLGSYKFIISPEGNGIDCHRHYEALISGCIPIIEENVYMRNKYKNLPILYTKNYSEITNEYLEEKYREMLNKEYNFSNLFIINFSYENQKLIKKLSDYWCVKMQKKKFYNDIIIKKY